MSDEEVSNPPTASEELRQIWPILDAADRLEAFRLLPRDEVEGFFLSMTARSQSIILRGCPSGERRLWMRLLAPDDVCDVIQEVPPEERADLLGLLDESPRREVNALLAYSEDQAGGLMSPRFARVRPEMTVDEAISYLRRQVRAHLETIYYAYAIDAEQKLRGVVSLRELIASRGEKRVSEVMRTEFTAVPDDLDQESVARVIAEKDLLAVPVLDAEGRMKGIVTVDDVVDVVQREATEDIQKLGGSEALDIPYMQTSLPAMVRKRGGWLAVLFVGEMLTASAMTHFEDEIAKAVVLAMFVPLIISSGGNSGSQASTLVIRAMALEEVRLRDWWRIFVREAAAGASLGGILALLGALRIVAWQALFGTYGEHYLLIAIVVAASLVGVVVTGTLAGSMLPLVLKRLGFDPASASAPFVATLVDVTGLFIYFTAAFWILDGSLL